MLKSQENKKRDLSWQKEGISCWVYNNNILPGKRLFLPIIINENPEKNSKKIKVILSYNKFASSFKIERNIIFKNSDLKKEDIEKICDISNLKNINRPEIFNFLCEKEKKNDLYFFCGLDFYFINNYKKIKLDYENKIFLNETNKEIFENDKNKNEAYYWLLDEKTLKPKFASPSLFLASIFKNFMMTFEKQILFLNGEYQSGKSFHIKIFLEFLIFINKKEKILKSARSRQRTIADKKNQNQIFLEQNLNFKSKKNSIKIEQQQNSSNMRNSLNLSSSFISEKFSKDKNGNILDNSKFYLEFNNLVIDCYEIIKPFINIINKKKQTSTLSIFKILLNCDKSFKFISFQFEINFLKANQVFDIEKSNFEIFYIILLGVQKDDLEKYFLERDLKKYKILEEIDLKSKKDFYIEICDKIKKVLGKDNFDVILRFVASILIFSNSVNSLKKGTERFEKIKELLKFRSQEIISFFLLENDKPMTDEIFQTKKNTAIYMLYFNLVNFVIEQINFLTKKNLEIENFQCLEIIDGFGYCDMNRYENYDQDNKFSEFVDNYFNEKLFEFFIKKRYRLEKKMFSEENLKKFFKDVFFVNNDDILKNFENEDGLIDLISENNDFNKLKKLVKKNFDVYLKKTFKLLNKHLGKDDKSQINYVTIKHYFSEIVNYDLRNLMEEDKLENINSKNYFEELFKIFQKNDLLKYFDKEDISYIDNSQLKFYLKKFDLFFENYKNDNIYFFNILKILDTESEIDFNKNLYNQFNAIDFESQIERYKKNFPYKISYDFLIEKFNVMNTMVHLNPNLNVNYKKFITDILNNMFGDDHTRQILFGKNNLFLKESFFEEFNELLKRLKNPNSEMKIFIEKKLREMMKEHKTNSNQIINISQNFLHKNCTLTKLEKMRNAKNRVVKIWRKKLVKKMILNKINGILDKIEYYNLAKVIRVQAMVKGAICRLRHKVELKKLKTFQFKRKVSLKKKQIHKTLGILMKLMNEQRSYKLSDYFLEKIKIIGKLEIEFANKLKNQEIMRNTLKNAVYKFRMIKLAKFVNIQNDAHKLIFRFLRQKVFLHTILNFVHRNTLKKRVKREKKMEEKFKELTKTNLDKNDIKNINFNFFFEKKNKLMTDKMDIYYQNFSISSLMTEKITDNFLDDFLNTIQKIKSNKDNILKISLQDNSIIIITKKYIYVIKPETNNIYNIRNNSKILKIGLYKNDLLLLKEDFTFEKKDILLQKNKNNIISNLLDDTDEEEENFMHHVLNQKYKITDFKSSEEFFIFTTNCRKLAIQLNFQNQMYNPLIFQFKRKITKISIGKNFFIVLDAGGVLYSYGDNSKGQLGAGLNKKGKPKKQTNLEVIYHLASHKETINNFDCGEEHVIAIAQSGRIYGWGCNDKYQLTTYLKNHQCFISFPRVIPNKFFGMKNIKYLKQVKCGAYSSYILFENKKLFGFGKFGLGEFFFKPKRFDLSKICNEKIIPVSLNVEYNKNIEIVYLKCIDIRQGNMKLLSNFKKFGKLLFEMYMKYDNAVLFYNKFLGKNIGLKNMSTKLMEVSKKNEEEFLDDTKDFYIFT